MMVRIRTTSGERPRRVTAAKCEAGHPVAEPSASRERSARVPRLRLAFGVGASSLIGGDRWRSEARKEACCCGADRVLVLGHLADGACPGDSRVLWCRRFCRVDERRSVCPVVVWGVAKW